MKEEHHKFLFYSVYPEAVATDNDRAILFWISQVNYELTIGNFEFSPQSEAREIRYRTSGIIHPSQKTLPTIRDLVYINLVVMAHYLPQIQHLYTVALTV